MAVTDALAKTIEDTKSYIDAANEKMNKAQKLLDDNVALVNQALEDYEQIKELVEDAKSDITAAIETISDAVDAGVDGDVLSLAANVAKGVAQVTEAMGRYAKVFADLKQKVENYKSAMEKNVEVIKTF